MHVKLGLFACCFVPSDPPRIQSERGKKLVELLTKASLEQNPTKEKLKKEIKKGDNNIRRQFRFAVAPDEGYSKFRLELGALVAALMFVAGE